MRKQGLPLQALHVAGQALPSGDAEERGFSGFLARRRARGWYCGAAKTTAAQGGNRGQVLVLQAAVLMGRHMVSSTSLTDLWGYN